MTWKVCILAAGRGSRMGSLTDRTNKVLLPLGGKAVISHIIDRIPTNIEIVVTVGYWEEKVIEYLDIAHPDRKFTYVSIDRYEGAGTGPGASLLACKSYLQCPFVVIAGDTICDAPLMIDGMNYMWGVKLRDRDISRFCTFSRFIDNGRPQNRDRYEDVVMIADKCKSSCATHVFIGQAEIWDWKPFWRRLENPDDLIDNELQLSHGLRELLHREFTFKAAVAEKWDDVGTEEQYNTLVEKYSDGFDFSKENEFFYRVDGRVIKYFENEKTTADRITRSLYLQDLCPEIKARGRWHYAYDFVPGQTVYSLLGPRITRDFLAWAATYMWTPIDIKAYHVEDFRNACGVFYKDKTLARIEVMRTKYPDLRYENKTVNGTSVHMLDDMLVRIPWNMIHDGIPSNNHGDLQFDNVVRTTDRLMNDDDSIARGAFKLLDWRQDFGGLVIYGDLYYDLAKLYGGLTVPYDGIKAGRFRFDETDDDVAYDFDTTHMLAESRRVFEEFVMTAGFSLSRIRMLRALIFINMAPLHAHPFDRLLYYLGRSHLHEALTAHGNR